MTRNCTLRLALAAILFSGFSYPSAIRAEGLDSSAYVAMGPGKAIVKVDLATGLVIKRFPPSVEPHGVAIGNDGGRLFAGDLMKGDELEIVDARSGAPKGRLKVGMGSHHLTVSPDGRWLYTTLSNTGQVAVRLRDGQGGELAPKAVEAAEGSGHHRKATLRFAQPEPEAKTVELVVKDVAGVPERLFRWTVK